jgi:hypothetical protein
VRGVNFGYDTSVSAKDREVPPGSSRESETPLSSSAVVVKREAGEESEAPPSEARPRRDSDPAYRLTPYRARLDVEMDDTAVSKVRDPSVSLVLGPEAKATRPRDKSAQRRLDALASVALGAALGALLVVVIVLIARAF